jgi:hypothetical protein
MEAPVSVVSRVDRIAFKPSAVLLKSVALSPERAGREEFR